jgi:hypothetical protein
MDVGPSDEDSASLNARTRSGDRATRIWLFKNVLQEAAKVLGMASPGYLHGEL